MSEWFWKKLDEVLNFAAIAVIFTVIVFESNIEIKDLDLWLHLGAGRFIVENLTIPHFDIFSCTVNGISWINHEWLFQVIIYWIHQLNGFEGIIFLQAILTFLIFTMILFFGYQSEKKTSMLIMLWLVFLSFRFRLTHRPDLFSILFFVVYIQLLSSSLKSKFTFVGVFLLQVLWTNMHGFFILGPALIGLALLAEWMKRMIKLPFGWSQISRLDDIQYKNLFINFFISVGACFLNPHTWRGVIYPVKVLLSAPHESRTFFQSISELSKPIHFSDVLAVNEYVYFKIVILLSLLSFLLNFRKIDVGVFLLWFSLLVLSLNAARNIPYFSIMAFFVFVVNIETVTFNHIINREALGKIWPKLGAIGLKVFLCFWVLIFLSKVSLAGYFDFDTYSRKSEYGGLSLRSYPTKAVDFLVKEKITGNFFNKFNSGAYLIGRTYPNIKVFIDGRTELYGAEFFERYQRIMLGDYRYLEEAVDQYRLTGIFLASIRVPPSKKIIKNLYEDDDWKLVYFDYDGSVFLKNIPLNAGWIKNFEMDLNNWKVPNIDQTKMLLKNATPFRHVRRAYGLFNMGFYDKAEQEAIEALKISPYDVKSWSILGKVALQREEYEKAFEYFRKAQMSDLSDISVRYNAALSLMHLDRLNEAEAQCHRILNVSSNNEHALFLLARIYIKDGKYQEAFSLMKKAYQAEPLEVELLSKVADAFIEKDQYYLAMQGYQMVDDHYKTQILENKIEALKQLME